MPLVGALDADEILVAANGHIYVDDGSGSGAAPTDAATAPGTNWIDLGYASEDGVRLTDGKTVTDIGAWQSFYALRKIITARNFQVAFALRQWNAETIRLAFGGGVITDAGGGAFSYSPPSPETLDERQVIVDGLDGDRIYRIYLPRAIVTENVEAQFQRANAADLAVTLAVVASGTDDPWQMFVDDSGFSISA
jgi:hypothetical protein